LPSRYAILFSAAWLAGAQTTQPKPAVGAKPRAKQSTGMRNENAVVNRIDFNAVKEANVRVGSTITIVTEPRVETSYFATEFGRPAAAAAVMSAPVVNLASSWHGELAANHQNSVFNARTFFQVGRVKPSRRNSWNARATGAIAPSTWLTATFSQQKIRGMVNGNVLVPLANERTPLTDDPALRPLITRFLNAYPNELPNRPDFDARALNTNAPQRIDEIDGTLRLDCALGPRFGKFSASHQLTRQHVDAFQLVAGQNPDNAIHTHRSQVSWRFGTAAGTEAALGVTFSRARTVLEAEPNARPFRIRVGFQIEELGPDSEFPVNRATNSFRYGGVFSQRLGDRHQLTWGADFARFQLNGIETLSTRGYFSFTNNFGRGAIENLRRGTPAFYEVTRGQLARGFRNWTGNAFVADRWKLHPRVQLIAGLRYNAVTGPTEANGIHPRPYPCDCNNFSPRLSLAIQAWRGWVARTGYTVSYGEIPPVTYQQVRFNLPEVQYVQLQNPRLIDPLGALASPSSGLRSSPTILAQELVSPYAHQYHFLLERKLSRSGTMLRMGYTGSQSVKLINGYVLNRAQPVPGIPLTLDTVDRRRPDQCFYETRLIVNGGRARFNAAQASVDLPDWRGLRGQISYTFSKSIDDGPDYTSTAANRDMSRARSQSQYESLRDRRGLSAFDSPHALVANYTYDLPRLGRANAWTGRVFNGWQISGVSMLKSGTPLTLFIGSDAPGFGNVDGSASDRPNILDPSILGRTVSHPDIAPTLLARNRFSYIMPGEPRGSLGRNTLRKARIANWNAVVERQWVLGSASREWRAQFRAEAYNVTNTPQFDEPQRNLSSPAFGKITNALNDGRVLQFTVRLVL